MIRPERRAFKAEIRKMPLSVLEKDRMQILCEVTDGKIYEWKKISTGPNTKPRIGKVIIKKNADHGVLARIGSIRKLQRLIQKAKKQNIMDENGLTDKIKTRVAKRLALNNQDHSLFREYVVKNENIGYDSNWRNSTLLEIYHFSGKKIKTRGHPLSIADSILNFSYRTVKQKSKALAEKEKLKWKAEHKEHKMKLLKLEEFQKHKDKENSEAEQIAEARIKETKQLISEIKEHQAVFLSQDKIPDEQVHKYIQQFKKKQKHIKLERGIESKARIHKQFKERQKEKLALDEKKSAMLAKLKKKYDTSKIKQRNMTQVKSNNEPVQVMRKLVSTPRPVKKKQSAQPKRKHHSRMARGFNWMTEQQNSKHLRRR